MSKKDEYMRRIVVMFEQMDGDASGEISYAEFCSYLEDPEMAAFAASFGIEATDLEQFFGILSANGQRLVDLETFVVGCVKLKGQARSVDMMDILITQRQLEAEQRLLAKRLEEKMDIVQHAVAERVS